MAADPAIEELWALLDQTAARQLLGRHLERAESVYRQYRKTAGIRDERELARLGPIVTAYLVDCLSILQRAEYPPEGMVYVRPGRVTINIPGIPSRRLR